ncbi:tape measure protein [Actinomycetaceae bacterium WB03_NA08]|uniref:Tape measure protein n=1 Tax=Scrofimicrobium canadense TaxID=2652290 RepID=A0A6N7VT57_9ACTO|nr:tape measure protein [Scrofimicrobium canadense]MSS84964.1 tape measure protein [Scrofimicrobium canadense]
MSSRVGTGHVAILPVMTGFKKSVSREFKSAGSAGAKDLQNNLKGAGRETGNKLGRDLKSAFDSSTKDLGGVGLKVLQRDVASASAALSKARLKQQDDAGRVLVAEQQLLAAWEKYPAGSVQVVRAEERLSSAMRASKASVDAVAEAARRLKSAQDELESLGTIGAGSAGGWRQMAANFRAGFTDLEAGKLAATGIAGALGSLTKSVLSPAISLSGKFKSAFVSAMGKAATAGGKIGGPVLSSLRSVRSNLAGFASDLGAPFRSFAGKVGPYFSPVAAKVTGYLGPVVSSVKALAGKLPSAIGSGVTGMVTTFGRGFTTMVSAANNGMSRVASTLRGPATALVTAAGAGIGVALGKGFSRLTAIDTASKKLTGFGHDAASVKTIMDDATTSVRGTAFGLGEAATVAGAAVAAGIKPGEQLQRHLKTVANNASAAGMSMEEMGSVMNRAATQANGVQNDVIGQLADRGIPIYQELAKELGVTAGEVFKMASEGKIDFETFSRAAEKAAGTVADEMGNTVPGSFKNLMASVGRIGANLLGGIYPKIAPLIQAVTGALGPIEDKAKSLGEVIGTKVGPVIDRLTEWIGKLSDGSLKSSKGFDGLLKVAGPLGGVLLALGSGGLGGLISRIPVVGGMLGGLGGVFKLLGGPIGLLIGLIGGLVATGGDVAGFTSAITGMMYDLVGQIPALVKGIMTVGPKIIHGLLSAIPLLLDAGTEIVIALVRGILTGLPQLVQGALRLVLSLSAQLKQMLPVIIEAGITLLQALITGIIQSLPLLVEGVLVLVDGLLVALVGLLPLIIEGGVQLLGALVQGLLTALPVLLEAVIILIQGLVTALLENLPLLIDSGIQLLMSLVSGLIQALPELITAALTLIIQLVEGLIQNLPELVNAGIQLVLALAQGLIDAIPDLVAALPALFSAIIEGFAGVDWLSVGANIVTGIISGLWSMAGELVNAMWEMAKEAFGGVLKFFGIASPSKLMDRAVGRMLPRGAARGVKAESGVFEDATEAMAKRATDSAQRAMGTINTAMNIVTNKDPYSPSTPTRRGNTNAGSGGRKVEINNYGVDAAELGSRTFAQFKHWSDDDIGGVHP